MCWNIKAAFPHALDNALKGLKDFYVYSFAFNHQLPAKKHWGNGSVLQVQIIVSPLAISLNTLNKKKTNTQKKKSKDTKIP